MTLRTAIGRHPSIAFVLLTLTWSWVIWFLLFPLVGQAA